MLAVIKMDIDNITSSTATVFNTYGWIFQIWKRSIQTIYGKFMNWWVIIKLLSLRQCWLSTELEIWAGHCIDICSHYMKANIDQPIAGCHGLQRSVVMHEGRHLEHVLWTQKQEWAKCSVPTIPAIHWQIGVNVYEGPSARLLGP